MEARKVYESETNLMTETDAGTEAKNGRTESLESWNTVDINEDTVEKMKKSN